MVLYVANTECSRASCLSFDSQLTEKMMIGWEHSQPHDSGIHAYIQVVYKKKAALHLQVHDE